MMDFAGLSDEPGARPVAPRRPSAARDRRGRTPHGPAVRPAPGHLHQPGSLTANRPAGAVDRGTVAVDTADQRQADYFLRLLTQNRRLIDERIDGYRKAIALAEAKGDAEAVSAFRRTARIEERERNILDSMIDNLHRRFPIPLAAEATQNPRGEWLVVR